MCPENTRLPDPLGQPSASRSPAGDEAQPLRGGVTGERSGTLAPNRSLHSARCLRPRTKLLPRDLAPRDPRGWLRGALHTPPLVDRNLLAKPGQGALDRVDLDGQDLGTCRRDSCRL